MGGSLKVVVREANGKVTKMCRWTNNLGYWFQTPEFINNPDKVLKEYIKAADESAYNYDKPSFAPEDYGLIVIDAVNKLILSHQDYSDLGMYHGARMLLDLKIHDCFDKNAKDTVVPFINLKKLDKHQKKQKECFGDLPGVTVQEVDEKLKDMKKHYDLFMMGAIQMDDDMVDRMGIKEKKKWVKSKEYKKYKAIGRVLAKKKKTDKDWLEFILYNRVRSNLDFFKIHLGEYAVVDFNSNGGKKAEYAEYRAELDRLGFKLTKKDQAEWKEYLSGYDDEDDDVEE
jgi:hypothetical protein